MYGSLFANSVEHFLAAWISKYIQFKYGLKLLILPQTPTVASLKFGLNKFIQTTLYSVCDYWSLLMLGFTLIRVGKKALGK